SVGQSCPNAIMSLWPGGLQCGCRGVADEEFRAVEVVDPLVDFGDKNRGNCAKLLAKEANGDLRIGHQLPLGRIRFRRVDAVQGVPKFGERPARTVRLGTQAPDKTFAVL